MQHTSERPLEIELIRAITREPGNEFLKAQLDNLKSAPKPEPPPREPDLLEVRPAAEWMKWMRGQPIPKKLFGDFWMDGELCILFADTNTGKSIMAVQLADSISRHKPIAGFELEKKACGVLYIDFELSTKQFEMRYTGAGGKHYRFNKNFYRAEVDLQAQLPKRYKSYVDFMGESIRSAIKYTGAEVVIIDNVTCMGSNIGQPGTAVNMMRMLKALKTRHWLSILVLAHTPKRQPNKPLTRNVLGGSKMLMNFADSAIAMGESASMPGHRYLKQVKQRAAAETYGADNVAIFKPGKTKGLLQFEWVGQSNEYQHLSADGGQSRQEIIADAVKLRQQGHSQREIAGKLGLGLATVNKLLREGARQIKNVSTPSADTQPG